MDTGQISMMPSNAGGPMLANAQPSSPITALAGQGEQAGSPFVGLLEGMTPPKTPQGAAVPVSAGKGVPVPEKNGENAATTVVQDGVTGLMAGLLNALDAAGKTPATGTEQNTEAPATTGRSDKKPQDVVLNTDGLQAALLIQMNSGRMPQADGAVEQQKVHGADKPLVSATAGSAVVPAPADALGRKPQDVVLNADGMQPPPLLNQVNGGRTPLADGAVVQQTVAASVADAAVTSLSNNGGALGMVAATSTDADGRLIPPESLLNSNRSAVVEDGPLKGASTDSTAPEVVSKGNEPQHASQKEPDRTALPALPSRQVSAIAGQQDQSVESSIDSTERGKAPSDQNGSVSNINTPVSGSAGPDNGGVEVHTTDSTGVEVTAQPQKETPLFRSASLEVMLAESAPQNEVRTTGQAQNALPAQDTSVVEIPEASTEKIAQTEPQQNLRPAKSSMVPVQAAPSSDSSQQPEQAATANNHTLEGTRSVQAAVVPAAVKVGVEAGGEAVQARTDSAAATKPVQSITSEAVKFAGAGASGEGFSTGDDKGTADSFMNGQFHAALMHQQGNADTASVTSNVSAPVQNDSQQSGLSEQIMQQVKDHLVNHEVKAGNDQIVLRLSPENLGDLKVNLSMDGQRLKVEIVAENHMVRDALLQNTGPLKESLARQNISMESFSVTTNGRGAGNPGQGQQQNDWHGFAQQKQQNAWMLSGGYRQPDTTTTPGQLAYQTPTQHTMVDLHF